MLFLVFFTTCCLLGSAVGEGLFEIMESRYRRKGKRRE